MTKQGGGGVYLGAKAQNVRFGFACFYFLVLAFGFTLIYNFALTAKY